MTEPDRKEFEAIYCQITDRKPDNKNQHAIDCKDVWESAISYARRTQDAKVRELVEAVERYWKLGSPSMCNICGGGIYFAGHQDDCPYKLAAQLKEQNDE